MNALFAIHDPGAAEFLFPLLKELDTHSSCSVTAALSATVRARAPTFKRIEIRELSRDLSNNVAAELLGGKDKIVLGTSWGSTAEQALRRGAGDANLPTTLAFDSWGNVQERLGSSSLSLHDQRLRCWVVDAFSKSELTRFGFAENQILIAGHPGWDEIFQGRRAQSWPGRRVLFLSEPYRGIGVDPRPRILKHVQVALEKSLSSAVDLVVFCPHPKDPGDRAPKTEGPLPWVNGKVSDFDGDELPALVLGYQTMGLAEWKLRGARAIGFPFPEFWGEGAWQGFRALGVEWVNPFDADPAKCLTDLLARSAPKSEYTFNDSTQRMLRDFL